MKLTINGQERVVNSARLPDLLAELQLPAPATLIEHNTVALRREEWPQIELRDGDRLELIRVVAGG